MLGNVGVASIVEKAVQLLAVGWYRARQVQIGGEQNIIAPTIATGAEGIAHRVENLESYTVRIAALRFEHDAAVIRPAGFLKPADGAENFLVIWTAGYIGELACRERLARGRVPDIGIGGVVKGIPLVQPY